jgi:hypothetical protein
MPGARITRSLREVERLGYQAYRLGRAVRSSELENLERREASRPEDGVKNGTKTKAAIGSAPQRD